MQPSGTKRNNYISYLKGFAVLSIILIHLVDWSSVQLTGILIPLKELLYPGVMFFIALGGSLVYVAYAHKSNFRKVSLRLMQRGLMLIGSYFAYSIIKLAIFNFQTEPYYERYISTGAFNILDILTFRSYSVPISIIVTIGTLLIFSPIFLFIAKKVHKPKVAIGLIITALVLVNYILPPATGSVADFLWARDNITIPVIMWLVPFLIGFYLAMWGFGRRKLLWLTVFAILAVITYIPLQQAGEPWYLSWHMYPLEPYYICASFTLMYALMCLLAVLEKMGTRTAVMFLDWLRILGDNSLTVYILQWLVIDLTYWLLYPQNNFIWLTVPLFIAGYTIWKHYLLVHAYPR